MLSVLTILLVSEISLAKKKKKSRTKLLAPSEDQKIENNEADSNPDEKQVTDEKIETQDLNKQEVTQENGVESEVDEKKISESPEETQNDCNCKKTFRKTQKE